MEPMARALELAALGLGRTAPNPPVGSLIVRDGRIVAEGYHVAAGKPHAEAVALAQAGAAARGATLFVTLEPCCHHGRTPPCTDAIVEAGIAEVNYAAEDPDPRVAGNGRAALEAAGIRVHAGACASAANDLLRGYLKRQAEGRPWVIAKYAMSMDGKIATRSGDSRWISGELSRRFVHQLRDRVDAVIVGIGTVLADDPQLTVRPAPADGRQPHRIVVDSRLRLPPASRLAVELGAGTIVAYVDGEIAAQAGAAQLQAAGLELLPLPAAIDGRVDLRALARQLGTRGFNEVLVEGGGELLAGFVSADLVDELACCVAPIVVGGASAPTPVGGQGADRLIDAARFAIANVVQRGADVWITARPTAPGVVDTSEVLDV